MPPPPPRADSPLPECGRGPGSFVEPVRCVSSASDRSKRCEWLPCIASNARSDRSGFDRLSGRLRLGAVRSGAGIIALFACIQGNYPMAGCFPLKSRMNLKPLRERHAGAPTGWLRSIWFLFLVLILFLRSLL